MAKERLDKLLVDRGLAPSRERARALILGGKVLVGERLAGKAGDLVAADAVVTLKELDHPYVSRGALKLVKALDEFAIDPTGKVALDVGASTGGFTDVLLRRGAAKVYAVDVGYGQLAWSLRNDPRVVVLERENFRYLDPAKLADPMGGALPGSARRGGGERSEPPPIDLVVIDTSFISLTIILPKVRELAPGATVVALVKPQFEVGKGNVGKGGVVREPEKRQGAVDKVKTFAAANGFVVHGVVESPILGPAGNVEFLMHLTVASAS